VNRNNFATLMVLLLPALLACYWTRRTARNREIDQGEATARAGFFVLCGAAMGLALLFSRSRGGIVCGMLSLGALTLGLPCYEGHPGRTLAILPIVLGGAAKESAPDLHVLVLLDSTRQIRLRARHRGCSAPPGPLQRDDTLGTGFPLLSSISAFLRRTARPPYPEETSAVAATDEGRWP